MFDAHSILHKLMTKICGGPCRRELPTESFSKNKDHSDGLGHQCKECNRAYSKAHYYRNKERYMEVSAKTKKRLRERLNKIKSVPCKDCGGSFPPVCMDFDHLIDKKFNIGEKLKALSWKVIEQEIAKCDIICSNCHRLRTEKSWTGTSVVRGSVS